MPRSDEMFAKRFGHTLSICKDIISRVASYLELMGVEVLDYSLGVYDAGEDDYVELRPYVEIVVGVEDVKKMLEIWRLTIDHVRRTLGDEVLDAVDVFFTRR